MRPHHGGVEHLNQVGRLAHGRERVEEGLEHASLARLEQLKRLPTDLVIVFVELFGARMILGAEM
jgi:hypothetical protein